MLVEIKKEYKKTNFYLVHMWGYQYGIFDLNKWTPVSLWNMKYLIKRLEVEYPLANKIKWWSIH